MATWKTSYGRYAELHVTATESAISVANNTSRVNVKVQIYYGGGTSTTNNYPQTLTVKVDGSTIRRQTGIKYSLSSGNRTLTIGEWNKTVTHNSDGSKTSNVKVDISDGAGDKGSINQNLALTKIAKASTLRLSSTTIPLGQVATLTISRSHHTFTHDIRYEFEGLTGQTSGINIPNGAGTSVTFKPPTSVTSRIPNSTSGKGRLIVTTKDGSTVLGTSTIGFTIQIPDNATYNPTISAPVATEQNSIISANMSGVWIQNQSRIRISAVASPKYSATIKSSRIYIGGVWHNTNVSGNTITIEKDYVPTGLSTHNYAVEFTDSRGKTVKSESSLVIHSYKTPRMTVSANRNNANEGYIDVSAKATGGNYANGNTLTMEIYIRAQGAVSWGAVRKSGTSNSGVLDFGMLTFTGFAKTQAYEVRIVSKDRFTNWSEAIVPISTSAVLMDVFKDKGVSFGAMYNESLGGEVQLNGLAYLNGNELYSAGDYSYGSNANGEYYRFPDGTQICTIAELPVTYSHAVRLQATWTYPIVFKGSAVAIANRQGYHGGTDGVLRGIPTADGAERTCVVRLWTASSNFSSADTSNMRVIAIGRWK